MLIDTIFSCEDFAMLEREYKAGKFPKALLLSCKDKMYLEEFAKAVSILVLDGKGNTSGQNASKVLVNSHPDVKIYPTKDKLLVADSEEIVDESFIKPIFADKKLFIIRDIDNSMESAQNKLLKVVEEPSKNVYMIITCTNPELVLPTIRSRCNKVELKRLPYEICRQLLSSNNSSVKELAIALSDGQIGKASELVKIRNLEEIANASVGVITKLKTSKQVLAHAKKLLGFKERLQLELEIIAQAVEDLIKIKAGKGAAIKLAAYRDELESVADEYSVRALCEISLLLDKVAKERTLNVNVSLILENLLLNILEVKYLCK